MREITCIVCPNGCSMKVNLKDGEWEVEGSMCQKGRDFAICEMTNPGRTLCTTVRTSYRDVPRLPVRTSREIPRTHIFPVMKQLNRVKLEQPVHSGDVIIKNVLDTGVDIIATSDMYLYTKEIHRGDNNV